MPACPYCDTPTDDNVNFCIECEKQVKCIKCGNYLLKDKSKCLYCGKRIESDETNSNSPNRLFLEEKQTKTGSSRKVELSCSDIGLTHLLPVLNNQAPLVPPIGNNNDVVSQPGNLLTSSRERKVSRSGNTELAEDSISVDVQEAKQSTEEVFLDYFEKDNAGFLISKYPDYKGKSKIDQFKRFVILYTWSFESASSDQTLDIEHLREASKKNGMYNAKNHSRRFEEVANTFLVKVDNSFSLNPRGKEEALKILQEIKNPDIKGVDFTEISKRTSSSSRFTKEDKQMVNDWISKESSFSSFDVRTLKKVYDYAIFALYDITKVIKIAESVKPSLAYEYLVQRYPQVSVTRKSFTNALNGPQNKQYFGRTPNGEYYLMQNAESIAKKWLDES